MKTKTVSQEKLKQGKLDENNASRTRAGEIRLENIESIQTSLRKNAGHREGESARNFLVKAKRTEELPLTRNTSIKRKKINKTNNK